MSNNHDNWTANEGWEQYTELLPEIDSNESTSSSGEFDVTEEATLPTSINASLVKISSCYFSVAASDAAKDSVSDLLSLLDEHTEEEASSSANEILYNDVMMHVLSYLDLPDLAAFSETSKNSNFECFYFLQHQLQRASLKDVPSAHDLEIVARIASLDESRLECILQEYLCSNTSLRDPPLSLTMLRKWIKNHVHHPPHRSALAARAALLVTLLGGAASLMTEHSIPMDAADFSHIILRLGVVGSLMGAAMVSETEKRSMLERMEALAHSMQSMSAAKVYEAYKANTGFHGTEEASSVSQIPKQVPSGCVGAFRKALASSRRAVAETITVRRAEKFSLYPEHVQNQLSTRLIDACASDDMLETVKLLVQQQCVPVDRFHVGSDGTQTCPLHASAFHGSLQVLEFLCRGVGDTANGDGGMADVNQRDVNGWSALHFAAGSNNPSTVQILLRHGAKDVEAVNGYTSLQWALRLQNAEVAAVLQQTEHHPQWLSREPLTNLARQIFSLIPSH
ncbi:hypothetical protein FisN_2Lh125 [Fistulifera solaris]|uniref:F-box domain-containing protein n=1 Tax=Fistulifera solaris TaxID=1519565 RepID=A0A1Z5JXJ2_FISSO|nr:hypothetical protein FisN_2Lh125 [Fistulifera solaris]|eukprot:GAX18471.1 hypothetical protein FisN_2Lh125 [Fistulifera solaris]